MYGHMKDRTQKLRTQLILTDCILLMCRHRVMGHQQPPSMSSNNSGIKEPLSHETDLNFKVIMLNERSYIL